MCHNRFMSTSENVTFCAITPSQVRAARGLLNWSQTQLADACGIPRRTIVRLEAETGTPQRRTIDAIRDALTSAGVEFIPENGGGAGVRLKAAPASD
jgi:transcriptional regulator with XRE-family HTH domain